MEKEEQISLATRKYRKSEQTRIRKKFRRKHGCSNCLNEWDFETCMEVGVCRYEAKPEPAELRKKGRLPCARNNGRLCPFENGTGTCFGFCIKEIWEEHKKRMEEHKEQSCVEGIFNIREEA